MKEHEARLIVEEIRDLCMRHGLWVVIEEEHKPTLKMIRIKEITIKVDTSK